MRLARIVVESFQAIQRAEVDFGSGLNVLYGPNDLGKSTLATAIRAALLVPPSSSEASNFTPWYADAVPRVALTFTDDTGHYWKVSKNFGTSGATSAAELHHSKDGTSFQFECRAREVEEKIRALLAWGIPAPGGRGGPRGLPTSFLANVLLGAQTDVDGILGKSLAEDVDVSGRLRLTAALATLAQDPLFKKVFDAAQGEVDHCFTPTGKKKKGQGSKFALAAQAIKQLQTDLDGLQRKLTESSAIEGTVNAQRERRARALMRVGDATAALATVRERLAQTRARQEARERLEEAKTALGVVDAKAARVNALSGEVEALEATAKARDEDVSRALAECSAAEAAVRAAEETHRIATSEDGARERELRRSHLAEQLAELNAKKQATHGRRATVAAAVTTRADAKAARAAATNAQAAFSKTTAAIKDARERAKETEAEVELTQAILAYGRWRAAAAAAEDCARAAQAAAKARTEGDEKDAAASALEAEARSIEEGIAKRGAVLPTEEQAKKLGQLERELEVAEAALGGGLSVSIKPRTGVHVHAVLDQKPGIDEPHLTSERVFEADRSVRLSVNDLLDIEVTAGAADKRRAVEGLRLRWSAEALPLFASAGVESVPTLLSAVAALAKDASSAAELKKQASQLHLDAKGLRERAAVHEEQATKLASSEADLTARKDAIGTTDLQVLKSHFDKLGASWESQANALQAKKAAAAKAAQAELASVEQAAKVAEYQASAAEEHAVKLATDSAAALTAIGAEDPEALLRTTDEELASLTQAEAQHGKELEALAAEATGQVESATRALNEAAASLGASRGVHTTAVTAAEAAKADLNARIGERNAMRAVLEESDRTAALALCGQRETELRALPDTPDVSENDLANVEREFAEANRELDGAKEELHKSEGALSKVGGSAVREEVERVQEALKAAGARERELEIDADAWRLLRDTLRDVENEEGAHLGRALAAPVASKFGELTGGRYKNLRLDAKLRTESVDPATGQAGGADVLGALSVGTRDQLATLIRVTIADQLKTAIVLDDHLVHTDPKRLAWFREVLTKTALNTQVIVFTCRPEDYLLRTELPDGSPTRDLAGGSIRVVDMARVVKRWEGVASRPPPAHAPGRPDEEVAT